MATPEEQLHNLKTQCTIVRNTLRYKHALSGGKGMFLPPKNFVPDDQLLAIAEKDLKVLIDDLQNQITNIQKVVNQRISANAMRDIIDNELKRREKYACDTIQYTLPTELL